MWRAFFLAVGAMLFIVGVETLLIDSATIYARGNAGPIDPGSGSSVPTKVVTPDEWLPWTSMSVGTIVVLYAFTLPQRWNRGGG